MKTDPYAQSDAPLRFAWGRDAAQRAAARGDVLVVVDVLSFSTAAALAVERGVTVIPCRPGDGAGRVAWIEGELAVRREEVPARGRYSLSPTTWLDAPAGAVVVLESPNGAFCATLAARAPRVLVGALVNAAATARVAQAELDAGRAVTVLACGERWGGHEGPLRVALEDGLGAGAILAGLTGPRSAEAAAQTALFEGARGELAALLERCGSGVELRERGFPDDVRIAAELDRCATVPELRDGVLARAEP